MPFIRSSTNHWFSLASLLSRLTYWRSQFKIFQPKIHDYRNMVAGQDYVFELAEGGKKAYITGQGRGIQVGDRIILGDDAGQYQVEQIDYYSNPSDMWIASVKVDVS